MWCNGIFDTLPDSYTNNISPKKTLKKVRLIAKDLTADFLRLFKPTKIPQSKIWFLVLTQNNIDALKDIKKEIPNSIFVSFYRLRSKVSIKTHYFSLSFLFFHDIIYPLKWFFYYLTNKKKAVRYYDLLFTVNGTYEECVRMLKKANPKAIVFTNDHSVISRALLLAANTLGIKTYYVQHASVTRYFPPLEFSHALLDGEDAYLKYKECGEVKSIVHLVGISKFDRYVNQCNNNEKLTSVGVAYNLTDEIDPIYRFLILLRKYNRDIKIIARAHPADQRELTFIQGVEKSNPKQENAFEFLKRIDCLISGDSSIHLEAALLNVYPCYFNFSASKRFDYYGYVKNNLVEFFEDFDALNSKIKELKEVKPNVQSRAKYYNAAINTNFYGKSTLKISEIILKTLNGNDVKE
tara:strand:+ start:6147 stop:7370 length:1224 start_codon:yes stop_codon:yes gene_type:complete